MSDPEQQTKYDEEDFRPSAARLVDSLRDTGYSPEAAFADIIDNSIAAGANGVRIDLDCLFGEVRIRFLDNGDGMTEAQLLAAMRYGSPKRSTPKSLGKFGMGLKTASTAFCQRLTVLSLKNGNTSVRAWDLETIRRTDSWKLETPPIADYTDDLSDLSEYLETSGRNSGTLVIWEKIDRLVSPGNDEQIGQQLHYLSEDLANRLGAIFSRFIDTSDTTVPDVAISLRVNGGPIKAVEAWEPRCLFMDQPGRSARTQRLPVKNITVRNGDGSEAAFSITGSILPQQGAMTADELARARYSLDNQGFYIYREGRLIWSEGWPPDMYKMEGKITRLRVVLDFSHELDDVFKIDFRKSRIIIPRSVREELKKIVAPWRNHTINTSAQQASSKSDSGSLPADSIHAPANSAIDKNSSATAAARIEVEKNEATLANRYNPTPVRAEGIHLYPDSGVRVREEDALEGNNLWSGAIDSDGEICVQLGRSHPYFSRLYSACNENPAAVKALDMLFWALANAELGTWSEANKPVIRTFRQQVSSGLNILCNELPDPSDD